MSDHDNRVKKAPKRAIIASRIYAPEPAAASFRLLAVQNALLDEGWEVEVLTTRPGPHLADEGAEVARVGSLKMSRWPVLRDKSGYVRGYAQYMSFDIPLFFRLLTARRADVILVEPPPTSGAVTRVAASLRRTPYVWYAPDIWSDAVGGAGMASLVVKVLTAIERFAVRGASGVVTVSEGFAQRVRELGGRNVVVIPGGIDTDLYRVAEDELPTDNPYFLYSGTASEWQGATIFAKAFEAVLEKHPEARLVYVGQGTDWVELEETAADTNGRAGRDAIRVLPPVSPERAAELHRGALAALVSIVPHEDEEVPYPYPTKVLSAVSSGVPVIFAGEGPATEEIRTNRLGLVVPYEVTAVSEAMTAALDGSLNPRDYPAERLHAWAESERSLRAMGHRVADFLGLIATGRKRG